MNDLLLGWSHWRGSLMDHQTGPRLQLTVAAVSGSKHLDFLLNNNLLVLSTSTVLDRVYAPRLRELALDDATVQTSSPKVPPDNPLVLAEQLEAAHGKEILLLRKSDAQVAAQILDIPELTVEVERAVEQVQRSLLAPHPA